MSEGQLGIQRDRLAGRVLGNRQVIAAQKQPAGEQIRRGRVGGETVLCRECFAGVVVAVCVHVTERQYIIGIDMRIRRQNACLLKKWDGDGGFSLAKQARAFHPHRFEILWVQRNSPCEGFRGFHHLPLLIQDHPSKILQSDRRGLDGGDAIQLFQRRIKLAAVDQALRRSKRWRLSGIGACGLAGGRRGREYDQEYAGNCGLERHRNTLAHELWCSHQWLSHNSILKGTSKIAASFAGNA